MAKVVWMVFHPSMAVVSDREEGGDARVVRRPIRRSGRAIPRRKNAEASVIDFAQAAARRTRDPSPALAEIEGSGEEEVSDDIDASLSSLRIAQRRDPGPADQRD